jgi:NADH dehydrogenase
MHLGTGRIVTNEYLEVQHRPNMWALGDCASITDRKTGRPYPPTAQHAVRQGKTVAKNVTAAIRGGTKTRFSFFTLGLLAAIGRRSGVANILGINFSGFVAWFLWRTIYLSKLPRLEKKVHVALDWTLDLLFSKDLVHLLDLRSPTVSQIEEEVGSSLVRSRQ